MNDYQDWLPIETWYIGEPVPGNHVLTGGAAKRMKGLYELLRDKIAPEVRAAVADLLDGGARLLFFVEYAPAPDWYVLGCQLSGDEIAGMQSQCVIFADDVAGALTEDEYRNETVRLMIGAITGKGLKNVSE